MCNLLVVFLCVLLVIWDSYIVFYWIASFFYTESTKERTASVVPEIIIFIPAHNEERVIGNTLGNLAGVPARVVVIADHCKDKTAHIARQFGAEVISLNGEGPSTKGKALAAALECFRPRTWDYVMILDADNIFPGECSKRLPYILSNSPQAVQIEVRPGNPDASFTTKMITVLYGFLNRVIQRGRYVMGQNALLCGTGMIFRRDVILEKAPWHGEMGLVEDMSYQMDLRRKGIKVEWIDSIWVDDEKPLRMQAGVVQGSRWLRGRWSLLFKILKGFPAEPVASIFDLWNLMPKPIFLTSLVLGMLNYLSGTVPPYMVLFLTLVPFVAWVAPSFVFRPYMVGPCALLYPFWQVFIQILHAFQAVRDRGKGWRPTEHFGQRR